MLFTAAKAVRVSEPRPSTSSLLSVPCLDVNSVPTPGHPRVRASSRMRSAAAGAGGTGLWSGSCECGGDSLSLARRRPPPVGRQWTPTGSRPHASVTHDALI
ncbi:hypothetical protein EVAR_78304_1 [Eumeta japonica]|uniref:Uncharacterized protein n=1 Tax=Eumeta variegata TaxID=151549 RepID=A0A4C1T459_EUMVA|nr:hypothetical protein EVAR_78304_1 [Eumeta japonica]